MKKIIGIVGAISLLLLVLAGCSNLFTGADAIVGSWQQASVNGSTPVLVTVVTFTAPTYTGSTAGVTANSGVWSRSGSAYTLTGSFFGFIATSTTITPTFSNWNNTLTYTDSSGYVEIYNRQ